MQAEYTNALATLGIKSVTFHSTIYQADSEKVRTNCGSNITTMKGLDTVESLSVEVKGSKNPGKIFLVL